LPRFPFSTPPSQFFPISRPPADAKEFASRQYSAFASIKGYHIRASEAGDVPISIDHDIEDFDMTTSI
jgi:hypothetical protein